MHSEMQKALHCPEALPKSAQKSCLHFRNKEKMLSELIQPWESSDLDKWPLCPLSSIILFGLQIGYLCGGDCVDTGDNQPP